MTNKIHNKYNLLRCITKISRRGNPYRLSIPRDNLANELDLRSAREHPSVYKRVFKDSALKQFNVHRCENILHAGIIAVKI